MEWCLKREGKLGGQGKIVEIDASKSGKKKSTTFGRVLEDQWVFSGVCHEIQKCFMVPVKKADNDTLLHVIKEQMETGTTITLVPPSSRGIHFRPSCDK